MFGGDGRLSFQQQGWEKPGEGPRCYKVRMCQRLGGAGQLDGGGPVYSLLFFRLENSVIRRKEKKSHKVSSYETKRREGDKQFPVASTFQCISVDFGLKPSFQPSRQAEVNLSGVIFIRTHHMRWPAVPAGP